MKKIIYWLLFILATANNTAVACDICGCGIGGNYTGLLPQFNKKIMGVRVQNRNVRTHLGADGTSSYLTAEETLTSLEYWGVWNLSGRARILASIPWQFQTTQSSERKRSQNGLGDISLMTQWNLLQRRKTTSINRISIHQLWAGAGIKLPTGKNVSSDNAAFDQLGTGSTDILLNLMYDYRLQDAGISATLQYRMNTANEYKYRFGNRITSSMQLYHKFRPHPSISLAPNIGLSADFSAKDKTDKWILTNTGGHLLLFTTGVETVWRKLAIGMNYQHPIHQDIWSGSVKEGSRIMFHTSILL